MFGRWVDPGRQEATDSRRIDNEELMMKGERNVVARGVEVKGGLRRKDSSFLRSIPVLLK